jgi:hypothetical protein
MIGERGSEVGSVTNGPVNMVIDISGGEIKYIPWGLSLALRRTMAVDSSVLVVVWG